MKNLLGGKGANLAEMAGHKDLRLPVPPGFTITTSPFSSSLAIISVSLPSRITSAFFGLKIRSFLKSEQSCQHNLRKTLDIGMIHLLENVPVHGRHIALRRYGRMAAHDDYRSSRGGTSGERQIHA